MICYITTGVRLNTVPARLTSSFCLPVALAVVVSSGPPRVPPTKSKPFVTEQTVLSSACHPVQNGNDWIVVCSLHCNEYCTQGNGWFSSRVITHATYWKSRSDLLVLPPCPHRQIKGPRQSQSPDFLFSDSTGKMTRVFRISMARWMGWPRRWTVP